MSDDDSAMRSRCGVLVNRAAYMAGYDAFTRGEAVLDRADYEQKHAARLGMATWPFYASGHKHAGQMSDTMASVEGEKA